MAAITRENSPLLKAAAFDRLEDVIYGRRDGHALTMDVFSPKKNKNGAGVMIIVSGEFRSNREMLAFVHPMCTKPFLGRGYTVFTVIHSSQPRYTVPDAIEDVRRSVRYVRTHATRFGIDPEKIGIAGASASGHLSLMMGFDPKPGDSTAFDPVERSSSKVKAVGCFFPPTDFLAIKNCPKDFAPIFDFREMDKSTGILAQVTPERKKAIVREISPINHVKKGVPPVLIIHGDSDEVVPISQSTSLIEKLGQNEVECKLVVKKGKGHLWFGMDKDVETIAEWFDRHLLTK